jgi:hypothetical protein
MIDEVKLRKLINLESDKKWLLFPQNNFFVANLRKHHLKKVIIKHFPEIKTINIVNNWEKDSINGFIVKIQERNKAGIWCNVEKENNCFYFDETGYLFRKSPESMGPFIINIKNQAVPKIGLGEYVDEENLVSDLIFLQEEFGKLADIFIKEIDIINLNHDFILRTGNNWSLYFDPKVDVKNQMRVFRALLAQGKLVLGEHIEYVDLRVRNKAYIKR